MTQHKHDCRRVFRVYDATCPRCQELAGGAAPRAGWGDAKRKAEAMSLLAIKNHDCRRSGCSVVCTFGDY
jgi:hypothetical protein